MPTPLRVIVLTVPMLIHPSELCFAAVGTILPHATYSVFLEKFIQFCNEGKSVYADGDEQFTISLYTTFYLNQSANRTLIRSLFAMGSVAVLLAIANHNMTEKTSCTTRGDCA